MDAIFRILRDDLGVTHPVDRDTPLVTSGVVDSFHVAALIAALEAHYHVRIDPADVGADNFDTVRQIHAYLQQRGR
jgi:acyl carrier protein